MPDKMQYTFQDHLSAAAQIGSGDRASNYGIDALRHAKLDNGDLFARTTMPPAVTGVPPIDPAARTFPGLAGGPGATTRAYGVDNDSMLAYVLSSRPVPTAIATPGAGDGLAPRYTKQRRTELPDTWTAPPKYAPDNNGPARQLAIVDRTFGAVRNTNPFLDVRPGPSTRRYGLDNDALYSRGAPAVNVNPPRPGTAASVFMGFALGPKGPASELGATTRAHGLDNDQMLGYVLAAGPATALARSNRTMVGDGDRVLHDGQLDASALATRSPRTGKQLVAPAVPIGSGVRGPLPDVANAHGTGDWAATQQSRRNSAVSRTAGTPAYVGPALLQKPVYVGHQIGATTTH